MTESPGSAAGSTAEFHLVYEGYLSGPDDDLVGSTMSFVRDGEARIVIDPASSGRTRRSSARSRCLVLHRTTSPTSCSRTITPTMP